MTTTVANLPDWPIGTTVRYWTGAREGAGALGRTRGTPHLRGQTPVVFVTGHGAYIALTHVQPVDAFPAEISVYCANCKTAVNGDYLVTADMDPLARLAVARRHLAGSERWSCTEAGDLCPSCTPDGEASMRLWCEHHDATHSYTAADVERIVYTLQGLRVVAEDSDPLGVPAKPLCLEGVIRLSRSAEGFDEYAESLIERRRHCETAATRETF